jgi:phosphodiesterase/alkaline phosphatase D-like protein
VPSQRKPSRRDFLKLSAAGAVLGVVPPSIFRRWAAQAQPAAAETLPNGVAVGDVTHTSAVFWAHSTAPGMVTLTYSESTAWFDWLAHHRKKVEVTDPTVPVKVQVNDLRPGVEYTYHVYDAAGSEGQGRFTTPPAEGKPGLRFGVSGDWRGELRPYVSLGNVAERKLDFFLEHGDTIYGDVPSLDFPSGSAKSLTEYRVKHNEVYSERYGRNVWADIRASTAIYATIDDHEVCNDFAGGASPSSDSRFAGAGDAYINQTERYRDGMQAFREYNPVREDVYENTGDPRVDGRPKLYRFQSFGSTAAIFILDSRSFRDQSEPQIAPIQAINPFAVRRSLASMFTPGRTMLGRPQVEQLKADLLAAHQGGITWKFVMVPEPIQQMGWFGGVDRWEGYAPERTEVLKFIEDNAIRNVVFISADVHTTFINNLTYQTEAGGVQIPTHCFEISTEAAAFYPPTGQIIMDAAAQIGLLSKERHAEYQVMLPAQKDAMLQDIFNTIVLGMQGFTPLGLDDSLIDWQRAQGETWVVGHTFGWCEFEIAPETETLTITTWGVPAYSPEQVASDPDSILGLTPEIMNQLVITPQTA